MAAGAIIAAATDGLAETPTGGHGPDNPWEIDAILFSNPPTYEVHCRRFLVEYPATAVR